MYKRSKTTTSFFQFHNYETLSCKIDVPTSSDDGLCPVDTPASPAYAFLGLESPPRLEPRHLFETYHYYSLLLSVHQPVDLHPQNSTLLITSGCIPTIPIISHLSIASGVKDGSNYCCSFSRSCLRPSSLPQWQIPLSTRHQDLEIQKKCSEILRGHWCVH
jgi:hypothetical protein